MMSVVMISLECNWCLCCSFIFLFSVFPHHSRMERDAEYSTRKAERACL